VEVLNYTKANTVFVSVLATKEVLEIPVDELVFLRDKTNVANTPNAREKRRAKKAATTNGTD
jgi:hypothetical protein